MMSSMSADQLSEAILEDVFSQQSFNHLRSIRRQQERPVPRKTNVALPPLPSLESQNLESSSVSSLMPSTSSPDFRNGGQQRINHFIHRITGVSGFAPGDHRRRVIDSNNEQDIAHHANVAQFEYLGDSATLIRGVTNIMKLYDELNVIVKELYHRKDLSSRVQIANDCYLALFQAVLKDVLSLQREKFINEVEKHEQVRQLLAERESEILFLKRTNSELLERIQTLTLAHNDLCQSKDQLQSELEALTTRITAESYEESADTLAYIRKKYAKELREIETKIRAEVEGECRKIIADMKHKWDIEQSQRDLARVKHQKQLLEKERGKLMNQAEERLKEMKKSGKGQVEDEGNFKRPLVCSSTQTEVNEYGLWDKQDGWMLPINGTLQARNRWRKLKSYLQCPKCRRGNMATFISQCSILLNQVGGRQSRKLEVPEATPEAGGESKKEGASEGSAAGAAGTVGAAKPRRFPWSIPDELVEFCSTLPRSIQAVNPFSLAWTLQRVWCILEIRKSVIEYGHLVASPNNQTVHPTISYLIELFLVREGTKKLAEAALYRVLVSLSEYYRKSPLLHIFCRFVGLLDSKEPSIDAELLESLAPRPQRSIYLQGEKASALLDQREREQDRLKGIRRPQPKPTEYTFAAEFALSTNNLSAYLLIRSCFLFPYTGIYQTRIEEINERSNCFHERQRRFDTDNRWAFSIPAHVYIGEDLKFWVPIDRAIRILHAIFDDNIDSLRLVAILRTLECDSRFLLSTGELIEPEVMHMVARTQIRRVQAGLPEDGRDLTWPEVEELIEFNKATQVEHVDELDSPDPKKAAMAALANIGNNSNPNDPMLPVQQTNKDFEHTIFVDMDQTIELIMDLIIEIDGNEEARVKSMIESSLSNIHSSEDFISFEDFIGLMHRVGASSCSERDILNMYREVILVSGNNNNNMTNSISSETIFKILKSRELIKKFDVLSMKNSSLAGLVAPQQIKGQASSYLTILSSDIKQFTFKSPMRQKKSIRRETSGGSNSNVGGGSGMKMTSASPAAPRNNSLHSNSSLLISPQRAARVSLPIRKVSNANESINEEEDMKFPDGSPILPPVSKAREATLAATDISLDYNYNNKEKVAGGGGSNLQSMLEAAAEDLNQQQQQQQQQQQSQSISMVPNGLKPRFNSVLSNEVGNRMQSQLKFLKEKRKNDKNS